MASGLLTGAYDRDRVAAMDPDDWRHRSPSFQEPALTRNLDLVDRLRPLAERLGTTMPALAVAWVLAQPGVTVAIVGARLPRQVDGWLPAAELELSADALAEIDAAIAATGAGSDDPPTPPPHMRPDRDEPGMSTQGGRLSVRLPVDGQDQRPAPRRRTPVGRGRGRRRRQPGP